MINQQYTIINDKLIYFIMFLIKCYEVIHRTEHFMLITKDQFDNIMNDIDQDILILNEFDQFYENDIYDAILLEQL